jgi:hypothetical protein
MHRPGEPFRRSAEPERDRIHGAPLLLPPLVASLARPGMAPWGAAHHALALPCRRRYLRGYPPGTRGTGADQPEGAPPGRQPLAIPSSGQRLERAGLADQRHPAGCIAPRPLGWP